MRKILIITILLILCNVGNTTFNKDSLRITNDRVYIFSNDWLGVKYKFGGTTKKGIDCSGFTQKFYENIFNIKLPRIAKAQYNVSKRIKKDSLLCGDLVFFRTTSRSGWHVGVYLADGYFIHAESRKTGVIITNLNTTYYTKKFLSGGRFLTI